MERSIKLIRFLLCIISFNIKSYLFGAVNRKLPEITNAVLNSAKEAVTLCITMLGVMSLWTGIMEVACSSGLIDVLTKK